MIKKLYQSNPNCKEALINQNLRFQPLSKPQTNQKLILKDYLCRFSKAQMVIDTKDIRYRNFEKNISRTMQERLMFWFRDNVRNSC
jgi:hypothetical protein